MSKPRQIETRQDELFRNRLSNLLDPKHPLYILREKIDWQSLETYFSGYYQTELGHPPLPIRLMVGLLMLQQIEGLSDERIVEKWVENPYYQYFCGYDHFQWELPINPSSLTRWRQRLGQEGVEKILAVTVGSSRAMGHSTEKSSQEVIVDTTVMEKAVSYPTDSKLLNQARQKLVKQAQEQGICLRQSYSRVGQAAYGQARRYGHAGQYKRMKRSVKKLKGYLGRVIRDIERKANASQYQALQESLEVAKRLLAQEKHSSNKVYSVHEPQVECIAKGKVSKRYEFGCKVSLVVSHKEGLVLSAQALHGNPYDGHTLKAALAHAASLSGSVPRRAYVDRGYRRHGIKEVQVIMAGDKNLPRSLKRKLKRRNAIEPHIGHMKSEGKLGRNYLKGALGDKLQAVLVAVGHNLRLLLKYLRNLFVFIYRWICNPLFTSYNSLAPSLTF